MSWEQVTLGSISRNIQTGPFGAQLHQSDYSDRGIPVVMPKDICDGRISEQSIARVSKTHANRLSRYMIQNGDIIYSRRGDVGRCAYVTNKEKGWLCGTGCLRIEIDKEKADSKFIFYSLQLSSIKKGKSRPKLSTLVTFCISLMLNVMESYDLIELAGYKLSQNYEVDRAYAELLQHHNYGDIEECNEYLDNLGIDRQHFLGVKSRG